jgi:hypothetical protein
MLKVIIAVAAVVLSVGVAAISFAPAGAEVAVTPPVRALKGDRLDIRPIAPVQKMQKIQPATQAREVRLA